MIVAQVPTGEQDSDSTSFARLLHIRVFTLLYLAETQSIAGDQLARVALSVLVFDRTGSAAQTALTYAATFLPALVGGIWLGRLGDRLDRRVVMIGCDVLRAACFAAMAVPAVPLPGVFALVVVAVLVGPVFSAAEVSLLSARLGREQFRAANALRMVSIQTAQVGGFVLGGLVVAVTGARASLLIDALTFVVSVLLVAAARTGPAVADVEDGRTEDVGGPVVAGLWRDRRLRGYVTLCLLVGLFVVPEGLAVPYGRETGASTAQVGMLLAAGALGGALGAVLIVRAVPATVRLRVAKVMAVLCGLPLVASGLVHSWPFAAACWLVSGMLAAYLVEVNTLIVQAIPDAVRSRLVGVVGALILGSQGLGLVLAGAYASWVSSATAIAVAGGVGTLAALAVVAGPLRGAEPTTTEVLATS